MATIKWVESIPSNASKVGNAPVDFRSVWTAVATGMAVEHFFEGSGGASTASSGDLRPGGSRAYTIDGAAAPPLSTSQLTARLAIAITDTISAGRIQRLRVYDSAGTYQVGTSWLAENAADAGTGYWLRQAGATPSVPTGSSTTVVVFPQIYLAAPTVHLTSSSISWAFCVVSSTTTNFTSAFSSYANAASTATAYWEALGTMSSVSY